MFSLPLRTQSSRFDYLYTDKAPEIASWIKSKYWKVNDNVPVARIMEEKLIRLRLF